MIGVSIAIPPPYGDELQRWRASFGDPLADSIPTHVTLLPPTEVPAEDLDEVRAHLESVAKTTAPFRMTLRGTGTFRPVSPVVFVQVAGGLAECEQLERAIRGGPLHRDLAFNYHPHVTVAHHVDEAAMDRAFEDLAAYTCTFEVRGVPPLRARHRPRMARRARLLLRRRARPGRRPPLMSVVDTGKGLLARAQRTRPWRAWTRYGDARGNVLAGGISYFAFFSIFPAVALAFTVFGFVLQNRPDLLQAISDGLAAVPPGLRQGRPAPERHHPGRGAGHRRPHRHRPGRPSLRCCWPGSAGSGPCATASGRSSGWRAPPATSSPTSCATSASW